MTAPRRLAALVLLALLAGCASLPLLGPTLLLGRADRQAREGAWEEAVVTYDEFLARYPADSAAGRVRGSRDTLAAMLTAHGELDRHREEVARLRAELARLEDEEAQMREDRIRLRTEAMALRDEVVRLREAGTQLRERLTRREGDLARTRQELAAQQAEAERLRADIERLKDIDLKLERKR